MAGYSMVSVDIKRNIQTVQSNVARAAAGVPVTIVGATKTVLPEVINIALDCGITDIGENRVQEYLNKRDAVKPAKWHFIGTLQTNKAKYLVGSVSLIQSINSQVLADEISRLAVKRGVTQDVLIEVNAAGESTKTGADFDTAQALTEYAQGLNGIRVRGLMTVPPKDASDEVYRKLRNLYETLARGKDDFNVLSVGMSGDYERAIRFGSNMVRIGSALFGARQYM
ncbi:MAG: YggS family pyridoxal phosphate-dependent enzyme [Clostridiales bacterium]|nr:YggS family pyridoxal phosphate-dependent enzyme [Clostridiales bacterium]